MLAAPPPRLQQGYRIALRPDGIVEVVIGKMLSTEDVEAVFETFRPLYRDARGPDGLVRVLVLMEAFQTPAIAMQVREHALELAQPGDRRAYVVATFLARLQMKRVGIGGAQGIFTDRTSAETWLKAA